MNVTAVQHTYPIVKRDIEDGHMVDEVRTVFSAVTGDGKVNEFKAYCSYKKHLVSSYKTNDGYQPRISETGANTITCLSESEFLTAFDLFAGYLESALLKEGTDFDASQPAHEYDTGKGIFFRSDTDWKKSSFRPLHCFPSVPTAAASTVTYNLVGQKFSDFITVLRLLWSSGEKLTSELKTVGKPGAEKTVKIVKTNLTEEIGAQSAAAIAFKRMLGVSKGDWDDLVDTFAKRKAAWGRLNHEAWFFALTTEVEREALIRKFKAGDSLKERHALIKKAV